MYGYFLQVHLCCLLITVITFVPNCAIQDHCRFPIVGKDNNIGVSWNADSVNTIHKLLRGRKSFLAQKIY
uniref:Putative secreted protein n=1 Tax=Panstrongylus lignarius TaxID=156445 RepID=A0A224XY25_9HEMI